MALQCRAYTASGRDVQQYIPPLGNVHEQSEGSHIGPLTLFLLQTYCQRDLWQQEPEWQHYCLPFSFLDLIAERLRREDLWQHEPEWQHYYGLNGTPDLLNVTTNFLQERLAKVKDTKGQGEDPSDQGQKLSAENLRMVNGVSGGLEALAWIISDPGDVVIVPTPTYARWNIG